MMTSYYLIIYLIGFKIETIVTCLKWNAIIGTVLFAYGVYGNQAVRNVVEERDSKYPAYRRYDTKNWNLPMLYLGAITLLPIRLCIGIGMTIFISSYAVFVMLTAC